MNIRIGIFGFLLGMAVLIAVSPRVYGEEKTYTVRKGETFFSIAQGLGIKADDLMKYNGITDPARLQAGQCLKIPKAVQADSGVVAGKTEAGNSGDRVYTMYRAVRGDTFFSIARKFSVTVDAVREANSLSGNYVLREGDSLRIPTTGGIPSDTGTLVEAKAPPAAGTGGTSQSSSVKTDVSVKTAASVKMDTAIKTDTAVSAVDMGNGALISSVRWPVAARDLSYMTGKLSGVVITGERGESVKSLTWGTVLSAGPYRGFGRVVIIQMEGGYLYVYGGCESLSVKEGDRVGPGTELGILGIDAVSNKPQLFFMVYRSNTPVDPATAPRA